MDTSNIVDESLRDWFGKSKSKGGKPGWVQSDGSPCANEKGETKTPKCFSSSRLASLKRQGKKGKAKIASAVRRKREQDPGQQSKTGASKPTMVKTFAKKKDYKSHPSGDQSGTKSESYQSPMVQRVIERAEVEKELKTFEESNSFTNPKLWDRAKKLSENKFDFYSRDAHDWACKWYKKKGGDWDNISEAGVMMSPQELEISKKMARLNVRLAKKRKETLQKTDAQDTDTTKTESFEIDEAARIPTQHGNVYDLTFTWRGKMYAIKMFFPKVSKPQKAEVQNALIKIYPGSVLKRFQVTSFDTTDSYIHVGTDDMKEDWQSVNRKDKTDGLSQKAVDAYKRENPGSKLKTAVTTKPSKLKAGSKSAKRRKSFCSRMKGMKKRLTSAKTARDPDSRINKALRRWNC